MSLGLPARRFARHARQVTRLQPRRSSTARVGRPPAPRYRWPWSAGLLVSAATVLSAATLFALSDRTHLSAESPPTFSQRLIPADEIKRHVTPESCWVAVDGQVWDVTEFLASHPGGGSAILRVAGTDASNVFNPLHPSGTLQSGLRPEHLIGLVDPSTALAVALPDAKSTAVDADEVLPLSSIIDLDDFERMAKLGLPEKSWSYYASTADDGHAFDAARSAWSLIHLRPRTLIDVSHVDLTSSILGVPSPLPIFIAPAALATLAHKDGELALCRGARDAGIIQCVSSNASYSLSDIQDAADDTQSLFFQLYVHKDPETSASRVRAINACEKIKAVYVTVDAPVGGKRVLDERFKAAQARETGSSESTSTIMFSNVSPSLTWHSLALLRSTLRHDIKLLVKGISTAEDAVLAYHAGVDGIVLSNHGGRQCDSSQAPVLTLLEIRKHAPWVIYGDAERRGIEVHVDGGVRRGSDVIKAVALGATACGLGRPFLYALANAYGVDGVVKVVDIVRNEMEIGMRLLGVRNLKELRDQGAKLVNTKRLDPFIADADVEVPVV